MIQQLLEKLPDEGYISVQVAVMRDGGMDAGLSKRYKGLLRKEAMVLLEIWATRANTRIRE